MYDDDPLEHAFYGFLASQILCAVDELGLFEALAKGDSLTAAELGAVASVPASTVERLLTGAVAYRLVERTDSGAFRLPEALRSSFRPGEPGNIGARIGHMRDAEYGLAAHLVSAVREGRPQWERLGSSAPQSVFDNIYTSREATDRFLDAMWTFGHADSVAILDQDPIPTATRLLDVGGGSGSFALPALRRYPALRAVVFDLPPVGDHILARAKAYGVADRLEFVAGDMFSDPLPEADACALGYILSDWDDDQGTALLRKCHAALAPGGRMLVLERLFDDDKRGPFKTAMADLVMLLQMYGRHRTEAEYRRWLSTVGFDVTGTVRSQGSKHLVWGEKASDERG